MSTIQLCLLAKLATVTSRIRTHVRDDLPFGAVLLLASRTGDYPRAHFAGLTGIMQADACEEFNELY